MEHLRTLELIYVSMFNANKSEYTYLPNFLYIHKSKT